MDDESKIEKIKIFGIRNVIEIDFEMNKKCLYWDEIINDYIGRKCLDGKREKEIIVEKDL